MASCIPAFVPIPGGDITGPPQWWDNSASKPRAYWAETLDKPDPRWNGATRHSYNMGTAEEGVFRAVHAVESGQPVLYLSWEIKHDPTLNVGTDAVFVGFQGASGTPHVLEIDAYSGAGPVKGGLPADVIVWVKQASGRWIPSGAADPTWTGTARAWLESSGAPPEYRWAINMRVPSMAAGDMDNTGINLSGASFKFFFALIKDTAPGAVPYKWPRAVASPFVDDATAEMVFPDVGTWDTVTLGSGAACGAGISLDPNDVGTTNVDPVTHLPAPHEILVSTVNPPVNHLFAKPYNGTGASIPANALKATFRTANWGSQTGWSLLTAPGATPWEEVLPGVDKKNAAPIPNSTKGSIEFDWTIPASDAPNWIPPAGTKFTHQCMLVTLESVGQNYEFVNDSIYRNMDFVKTSTFNREVEINVGEDPKPRLGLRGRIGLPPATAKNVYIQVQQTNMPKQVPVGKALQPVQAAHLVDAARTVSLEHVERLTIGRDHIVQNIDTIRAARDNLFIDRGGLSRGPIDRGPIDRGPIDRGPIEEAPVVKTVPPSGLDELARTLSTVRYFVFRETGKRIKVGGRIRPLLEEQTSFGYFIQNTGPVVGFDHALGGPLAKVGPNIFRLSVTPGRPERLFTKVIGYEKQPPRVRMAEIIAGPKAKIQPSLPIAKNLPGLGSVVSRVTSANVVSRITNLVRRPG